MSWFDRAWATINLVHETLPADATFEQRQKALKDAYPFGERSMHPYKMWCKVQRQYLSRYQPSTDTKRFPLSPLEKLLQRAGA